jgi:hypothetical protein
MSDTSIAAIGHEWKGLLASSGFRRGGMRSLLLNLLAVAVFGILVPWKWGFDFFDAFVMLAYGAIALVFAASAISALMTPGASKSSLPARIIATGLHGWSVMVITVALGIATVNFVYHAPRFLHPRWTLAAACLLLGLAGSILIASLGALLSILFSPTASRTAIRILFLALLLGANFGRRYLPLDWQVAIEQQLTTPGITRMAWVGSLFAAATSAALIVALGKANPTNARQ